MRVKNECERENGKGQGPLIHDWGKKKRERKSRIEKENIKCHSFSQCKNDPKKENKESKTCWYRRSQIMI